MEKKRIEQLISHGDAQKLLTEMKEELHEENEKILDDVKVKIDEQIEFSVNKRMKDEEKRIVRGKNWKIFNRDLFIAALILVIGYLGYCLYKVDYFSVKDGDSKPVVEPVNDKEEEKEKLDSEYYIENYRYLVDDMQILDNSILDLYGSSTSNTAFPNELILKIAYKNLDDSKKGMNGGLITFTESDLLESAKNIFGDNTNIVNQSFVYNNTRFIYYNNSYIGEQTEDYSTGLLYEINKASLENDILSFDIYVAHVNENGSLVNMNDEIILDSYNEEGIENYSEMLSIFRYNFKSIDGKYTFLSISKIK